MSDSDENSEYYYDSDNSDDRSEGRREFDAVDDDCVCCGERPPNPHLRLEDGFYCEECYESQKSY